MFTSDEWRRHALGRPDLSDAAVDEFRAALQAVLNHVLDAYFGDELDPDDEPP